MITYQDFLQIPADEKSRSDFVRKVIQEHKTSALYLTALDADAYDRGRNSTIMAHQNMITTLTGQMVPDQYRANHKSTSNFFNIFLTQLNQYLLGNGVTWKDGRADSLFGGDFDNKLQKLGKLAMIGAVSFGFWNIDRLIPFSVLEFAPLYDEENGALMAGVRFWQIDASKPLRATFYEVDGYTDYLWQNNSQHAVGESWTAITGSAYFRQKLDYKLKIRESAADGVEVYNGENYPSFPIIPLYANDHKQSELVGLKEKIDAYDLILNGFENDLDNAQIYWIIKGAGGMDDPDLAQFLDRLHVVGAAAPADGQEVEPVTVSIPYDARERLLERLEKQLYRDAMIMDPETIANGAATATQIKAAYERQNNKADMYEYCILDFLHQLMELVGVEDEPTFTRSVVVNTQEEIQSIVMAAQYLDPEYVTTKILTLLGDGDQAEAVLKRMQADDLRLDEDEDDETVPEEPESVPEGGGAE